MTTVGFNYHFATYLEFDSLGNLKTLCNMQLKSSKCNYATVSKASLHTELRMKSA